MSRNLQARVTGDAATLTPGERVTGLYGGVPAHVLGYLGTKVTGALQQPVSITVASLMATDYEDVSVSYALSSSITLNGPSFGTTDVEAIGSVSNTGGASQTWTLSVSAGATVTPSSGTTAAGASTSFTVVSATAGSYTVTLTNTSGGAVVGSPDTMVVSDYSPPAIGDFVPRNADTLLFQPLDARYRTATLTTAPYITATYDAETDINRGAFGPTWQFVDQRIAWLWTNPGVDWIGPGPTYTPQSSIPWHQSAAGSSASPGNNAWYATPITELTQYAQENNRWLAMVVRLGGGPRTIGGRHSANPPRVEVTYTDATTATLACRTSAYIGTSTLIPNTFGDASGNIPISDNRALLEFERPTKAVSSATLHYFVTQHFGATAGLMFNLITPPTATVSAPAGVAMTVGTWDLGIDAVTGVLGHQRYTDDTTQADWVTPDKSFNKDAELSPEFWGGAVDTGKLPHSAIGPKGPRWVNATPPPSGWVYGGVTFIQSTYSAGGFYPLVAGLGAIKATIPRTPGVDGIDGGVGGSVGATGCLAKLFLPPANMGYLQHIRVRFYTLITLGRPITFNDRRIYIEGNPLGSYAVHFLEWSGKWGITPSHDCSLGGVSGTSGAGRGWQHRLKWIAALPADTPGPDFNKFVPGTHIRSDFKEYNVEGYNYSALGWPEDCGKVGGRGGTMDYGRWHLVEMDLKLNSVLTSGLGYVPDGHLKMWIDEHLVFDDSSMVFRSLPINPGVGAAVITPDGGNAGSATVVSQAVMAGGRDQAFNVIPETLTLEATSPTTYSITGSFRGAYGSGTVGALYATTRHRLLMTGTPTVGDKWTVVYPPFYSQPSATNSTPMRELGVRDLWFNIFHGGKTPAGTDINFYHTGLVYADGDVVSHIGPMKGADGNPILPNA